MAWFHVLLYVPATCVEMLLVRRHARQVTAISVESVAVRIVPLYVKGFVTIRSAVTNVLDPVGIAKEYFAKTTLDSVQGPTAK